MNTSLGRWLTCLCLCSLLVLLAACGGSNTTNAQQLPTTPATPVPVNGFGGTNNHVHSLLVLPDHVIVLATHYGLFRSADEGKTWQEVAGRLDQIMPGLMTYAMASSPMNPHRLYVMTQPSLNHQATTLGIYTSADEGRTWQLSIATSSLTSDTIFTLEPGNDTPDEVYIYLRDLGSLGLRVSLDDGQHFSATGTLPFSSIYGLLALPGEPGHLLAYGIEGIARTTDGGAHWQVLKGINGSVNEMTTPGPHRPIYASGDAGIYASSDDGQTFTLVNSQASYASLTASSVEPNVIYGETALSIYRSTDGGHTWSALPHVSGNLAKLVVDPSSATQVYLSLSYPTEMFLLSQKTTWESLTPQTVQ
jgi:BNR/Asp-box repeat